MTFGIQPRDPGIDPAAPWWGARAIFESNGRGGFTFSLLGDRQQCTGAEGDPARVALVAWVTAHGLMALRREIAALRLEPRDRVLVEVRDQAAGYIIVADPKGSHGHLYIGAAPLRRQSAQAQQAVAS